MTYRKRAKGGWNAGKAYKKESNRSERQFSKDEIKDELQEILEGEDFRYPHYSKTTNELEKTKYEIKSLEHRIVKWTRFVKDRLTNNFFNNYLNSLRHSLKKTKEKYKKMVEND